MLSATRRWFRHNRTPLAVGVGVVGAGYVATQYLLAKINDARERMSSDRIAKENLRRRFEQNQEDCTFTVLALLPTVTTNVLDAMNTEGITYQIQHTKSAAAVGVARSVYSESAASISPSIADTVQTEDDGRSVGMGTSVQSESGVHASQVAMADDSSSSGAVTAPKRKTKRQLWDELTISSITRAYTLLYTVGLLVMITRIQLNLLGRRSYLSSVVSLATGSAQATISLENNDDDSPQSSLGGSYFEVNRKYLAFSWWLLNRSWADIQYRVETAVRATFGHLSPRDFVSLEIFADLTRQVRQAVEQGPLPPPPPADPAATSAPSSASFAATSSRWLPLVLPPPGLEDYVLHESGILADSATAATFGPPGVGDVGTASGTVDSRGDGTTVAAAAAAAAEAAALRRLLDETADLVDSPTFSHVLTQILDAGFATLTERKIAPAAFDLPPDGGEGSMELVRLRHNKTVQLPKVLSVLTRQAHTIGSGMPNEYLQEMEAVRDLEAFAAVVYSSNWESEIRDDGLAAAAAAAAAAVAAEDDASTTAAATVPDLLVEESSLVVVTPALSRLESAWERAVDQP
ncbi:peroxisomal membrane protein [Grosmannia clavigera kw1407]|uniref:Peroxisomal membrane protein n=1 Tax=Grosmannia clavigera (strain kw1407 / UAMH 11150) TaxID=655863 RepID=F0XH18_GROCL|nr:peroxisomal membrane protein [Grosmannia clavigera kw1407]EFX03058.1 peroxisomal membrane protein [Grosmannia clavigera kw1407]